MPFMRTYLLVAFFLFSGQVFGQRSNALVTYRIDTLNKGTDSSTFFIRKFIDTTLVESYKCKFDSTDFTYRHGLFRLKKGKAREYRPVNIYDKKEYPWREVYPGLRDGGGELRIFSRQE
jgi:hypothetical protein